MQQTAPTCQQHGHITLDMAQNLRHKVAQANHGLGYHVFSLSRSYKLLVQNFIININSRVG